MAANKELLVDILDGVLVAQQFLNESLSKETLSPGCDAQRKNVLVALETIIKKIQSSHPSVRPRVNTPGKINKPVLAPPIGEADVSSKAPPPPVPEDVEVYEDPSTEDGPQASDYLSFYPASSVPEDSQENDEQEMYEAMETNTQPEDTIEDLENYEDPAVSLQNMTSSSSLSPPAQPPPPGPPQTQPPAPPPISQSSEEGDYATTTGMGPSNGGGFEESIAMDWGSVYTTPPKGEKLKVTSLKNVKIKGPLEKLGGRNHKTWQKRYCVLAGPLMYFYEKEGSKTYNNYIAVTAFTASLAQKVTDTKKHFGFKLTREDKNTGRHKDYYFRTTSQELRDKWLSCIQNAEPSSPGSALFPQGNIRATVTLPRNTRPSEPNVSLGIPNARDKKRALSVGNVHVEEEGELYEDMAIPEEGEDKIEEESDNEEEYVAVDPAQDQMSSSEEYIDVTPQEQENYEEPSLVQPPPPLSPPPGPPSEVFFSKPTQTKTANVIPVPRKSSKDSAPAPKSPAPPPPSAAMEPVVDTNKVYTFYEIPLDKVYVSQWDFAAGEKDELGLKRGDLVYVSEPSDAELWWYGELLDEEASKKVGPAGFFPKDYSTLAFEAVSS